MTNMRSGKMISIIAAISASVLLFTGCTSGGRTDGTNIPNPAVQTEVGSMEDAAVLEYDIPVQHPALIIDRNGYSTLEKKYAYAVTKYYPCDFKIIDDASGETVFEGSPEHIVYREDEGVYVSKLFFEELQTEGTYHIEMDLAGESYPFLISDTCFEDVFDVMLDTELAKCKDGSITAQELYSLVYIIERQLHSVPDYEEENPAIISVVGDFIDGTDVSAVDEKDRLWYSAAMAKFAYCINKRDRTAADAATEKAKQLYRDAVKSSDAAEDEKFLAACDLYRRTGDGNYHNDIDAARKKMTDMEWPLNSRAYLFGAMCYMTTTKSVNTNFCDYLIRQMLTLCEDVSKNPDLVDVNLEEPDVYLLLGYCQQLAALNQVLEGYQYNALIANYMHFMSGRNHSEIIVDLAGEYPADSIVIYSWLTMVEKEGKMSPSAQLAWSY